MCKVPSHRLAAHSLDVALNAAENYWPFMGGRGRSASEGEEKMRLPKRVLLPSLLLFVSSVLAGCQNSPSTSYQEPSIQSSRISQPVTTPDPNEIRKRIVLSQMQDLEIERNTLSETVNGRRSKVATLEEKLYKLRASLEEYKGEIKAYMMNHMLAIASIAAGLGGGAVALDPDNEFTTEARQIGGVVSGLGALYAAVNYEETIEVADKLIQADVRVKDFKKQILEIQEKLDFESKQLISDEENIKTLTDQIAEFRSEISSLQ